MNNNLMEDLEIEAVITCPVCLELPTQEIFSCKTGHHICKKCKRRLTACPTCQSALTGTRNYLAEAVISKLAILKIDDTDNNVSNSSTSGVSATTSASPTSNDISNISLKTLPTPPGIYYCILEHCRLSRQKRMAITNMHTHLKDVHPHLFDKFKNTKISFKHVFENFCFMKGAHKLNRAFHISNMGMFFLNLELLADHFINCWITYPGSVKKASRFNCVVEFISENGTRKMFSTSAAAPEQNKEWLQERGRVFILDPASHGLTFGDNYSLSITVTFNPRQD